MERYNLSHRRYLTPANRTVKANNVEIKRMDSLQCMISNNGRSLVSFNTTGIESLPQLFLNVKEMMKGFRGILTLNLRNASRGWAGTYSLCLV